MVMLCIYCGGETSPKNAREQFTSEGLMHAHRSALDCATYAHARGIAEERARVVAWLDAEVVKFRAHAEKFGDADFWERACGAYEGIAEQIERGDHDAEGGR